MKGEKILQSFKESKRGFSFFNLKKLFKKQFVRNVMTVASGTAAAQGVTFLFSPIITRLYGPEAFGVLGVFTSIVTVTSAIAALSYPIAIVLPKKDTEARALVRLSLCIALLVSTLTGIVLFSFEKQITNLMRIDALSSYLLFIPLSMFFIACHKIAEQWLIRKKQFKVTAKVTLAQSIILNSAKTGVGLFYPLSTSLIYLATIGNGLHAMMLSWGARFTYREEVHQEPDKGYKKPSFKKLAEKYSDFPKYRAPQEFISTLTQSMPILMLTVLFGPVAAGFYAIGVRVLALPSQLIGTAVADVFYPRIVEADHKGEALTKLLIKATLAMATVGFIPFGIVILLGPILFSFIFGAEWETAGLYARWIAVGTFALFISKPCLKALPVLAAQKLHLFSTIINILLRTSSLLLGAYIFNNDVIGVALFGISGAFISVILILITILKSKAYDDNRNN